MRLFIAALTAAVAIVSVDVAVAAKPEAVAAREEGRRLAQNNQIAGAIQAFRKATQLDPSFAEAWIDLGNTYLAANDPRQAVAAFTGALNAAPDNGMARYNLAYSLRKIEKYPEAAEQYRLYLKAKPNDAEAYYGLAESLRSSGDLNGAADAFDAYAKVEKRPDQKKWVEKARQRAADLRKQAKKTAKVAAVAPVKKPTKKVTKQPKLAAKDPKKGVHMSFSESGAPPPAKEDPQEAAVKDVTAAATKRPEAFRAGLGELQRGEYAGAAVRLKLAMNERPNDAIIAAAYGSAQLGLLDGVAAEKAYTTALRSAPDDAVPGIYLGLGEAQRIQGKIEAAKASYKSAAEHAAVSQSVKRFSQERLAALQ